MEKVNDYTKRALEHFTAKTASGARHIKNVRALTFENYDKAFTYAIRHTDFNDWAIVRESSKGNHYMKEPQGIHGEGMVSTLVMYDWVW